MSVPMRTEVNFILDPEGILTEIGEHVASLVGYTRDQCVGRSLGDLVHSGHRAMLDPLFTSSPADPHPEEITVALVDCEGVLVYTRVRSRILFHENGEIREIQGTLEDVTIPGHREKTTTETCRRLGSALRKATVRDPLTGVYTRLRFEELIADPGTAFPGPVSIFICDIDGLREVNNTQGFAAGNQLLIDTANLIRATFRDSDLAARTAGSQFTVILPKTNAHGLTAIRERFRKAVSRYNKGRSGPPLITAIGTASGDASDRDVRTTFLRAENMMYRKKLHRPASIRHSVVKALLAALSERDAVTEAHAERISHFAALLGTAVGLAEPQVVDLQLLAQFHDIGKLAVPDHILLKPGPLSKEERIKMNRHPEVGYRIALSSPDLAPIAEMILAHHEWWNGEGYPSRISGTDIPLECRILAVVDAYDAMTSDRPYRKAMSHRDAMQELVRCSGTQFDPQIVKSFIRLTENGKGLCACQS